MLTLIELFCGRGGWTKAALRKGWKCIGYDIADHNYPGIYRQAKLPCPIAELANERPTLVIASPPCEDYARKWLPWLRRPGPVDERLLRWSINLAFQLPCPVIVECSRFAAWEVPGATPLPPYYLWGDVPALLPRFRHRKADHRGNFLKQNAERAALSAEIPSQLADWIIETARSKRVTAEPDNRFIAKKQTS